MLAAGLLLAAAAPARSGLDGEDPATGTPDGPASLLQRLDAEWGGHLRLRGGASRARGDSLLAAVQGEHLLDGGAEVRLKNTLHFGRRVSLETHYEAVVTAGDTVEARRRAAAAFPGGPAAGLLGGIVDDDTRFFDLTRTVDDGCRHRTYHRLDRLALTFRPSWGTVVAGRQALTWGNGLVFNPMDLFNPFSPTDVERDYKVGDDMLNVSLLAGPGELQALAVPRRDPETGDLEWRRSSTAVRLHTPIGPLEADVLAARHYEDVVAGAGLAGYLGGAAWRADATWTALDEHPGRSGGYLSLVANIDYSWVWGGRNCYGFIECYFNGAGSDDAGGSLDDPVVLERVERGELFTLGRRYVAASLQYEAHPLLNGYVTAIHNLNDGSGTVQPRLVWDVAENLQALAGLDLPYGGRDTEFGGLALEQAGGLTAAPATSAYLWVSWYF
jgi:hypothetical protein